jgi:hypothetical protein
VKIKITKITNSSVKEWNEALEACPHATYFHSYEWADIWQQYRGLTPRAKRIEFSDGATLILPCSYILTGKGWLKHVVMSPATTFGGALYNPERITEEHLGLVFHEVKKFSSVTWRQNPYETLLRQVWPIDSQNDMTHTLNLTKGFDAIYKSWTKGNSTARKARKARKQGVSVELAATLDDWQVYYRVYEDSLKRWGDKASSKYEWELFNNIYMKNSSNIKLWLSTYQNKVIAGALCFYTNKHAVYWHGATLKDYFHLRPVNLLMYEIIKHACEAGYDWYDFNPSGGHKGVVAFKKSFGCDVYKSNVLMYKSVPIKFISLVRRFLR